MGAIKESEKRMTPEEIADRIIKEFDTDKDGYLNRDEIVSGITRQIAEEQKKR